MSSQHGIKLNLAAPDFRPKGFKLLVEAAALLIEIAQPPCITLGAVLRPGDQRAEQRL
ncbi:MAG: hypothetical protein ACE5FO_05685 [Parvularculaceae bacterium]